MTIDLTNNLEAAEESGQEVLTVTTLSDVKDSITDNQGKNVYLCIPFADFSCIEQDEINQIVKNI